MPRTSARPWGSILAELAARAFTGQVWISDDHCIAFDHGTLAGATSPLATDSVVRLALTNRLIGPAQVTAIQKRIATRNRRDEVDVLASVVTLSDQQATEFRRKLVQQRAARTFALDTEYRIESRVSIACHVDCDVDVRAVIFQGALMSLSPERFVRDMSELLPRFKLKAIGAGELAAYDFASCLVPVLTAMMRDTTSLAELEALHRDIDPRMIAAAVYSLLVTETCVFEQSGMFEPFPTPPMSIPRGTGDVPNRIALAMGTAESPPQEREDPRERKPREAIHRVMIPQLKARPVTAVTMPAQPLEPDEIEIDIDVD